MTCVQSLGRKAGQIWRFFGIATFILSTISGIAWSQVELEDYPKPILARNGKTHFAPIKDLAFARGGRELLSAGQDKVIQVWDLENRSPEPIRTLRPPIFRGEAGEISSIALNQPDNEGQSLLAVAGYSPGRERDTIVLMRYPGRNPVDALGTGEILGYLQSTESRPEPRFSFRISRLAFDRSGRYLVSADLGGQLKLWDLEGVGRTRVGLDVVNAIRPIPTPLPFGNGVPITAMVLSEEANGNRSIVTGDTRGTVRRWDFWNRKPSQVLSALPVGDRDEITSLGGGGGLRWVVFGTLRGRAAIVSLVGDPPIALRNESDTRIWALDASPDGTKIALSLGRKTSPGRGAPPAINGSDVFVYGVADGTWKALGVRPGKFPIQAVRFGPGSLAFAGDEDQSITVRSVANLDQTLFSVAGQGSVIWDVAFVNAPPGVPANPPHRALAFSRNASDFQGRRRDGNFEGFDLSQRQPNQVYPADRLFRVDPALSGFQVIPQDPYTIQVTSAQLNRTITLQPRRDGPWYSYLFLPPNLMGVPLLAVGTGFGISIFNIADEGKRTRFLYGHESTVTALGISPDGKWLVSGSADQSVRLWAIREFDRPTPFGAKGVLQQNRLLITEVADRSAAKERGLRPQDLVDVARINPVRTDLTQFQSVPLAGFLNQAEALDADQEIQIEGHRSDGQSFVFSTRKRTAPTLSLFPDRKGTPTRDWVLWAPKGFYRTSIGGDEGYLGWHRNVMKPGKEGSALFVDTQRTIFSRIAEFRDLYQKNDVIDQLIAGVPPIAGPVKPEDRVDPPPLLVGPTVVAQGNQISVHMPADAKMEQPPPISILADNRPVPLDQVVWTREGSELVGSIKQALVDSFGAGARIWAQRIEAAGKSGPDIRDFKRQDAATQSLGPPGKAFVFACSAEGPPLVGEYSLTGASKDIESLSEFFLSHQLLTPKSGRPLKLDNSLILKLPSRRQPALSSISEPRIDPLASEFLSEFNRLDEGLIKNGDVLLVILEARILYSTSGGGRLRLGDAVGSPEADRITTDLMTETLTKVARNGCRVYLFLDDVHKELNVAEKDQRDEWIRRLLDNGINCYMASESKPSWPLDDPESGKPKNRLFARSILGVFENNHRELTPFQFGQTLRDRAVSEVSSNLDSDLIHFRISSKFDTRDLFIKP